MRRRRRRVSAASCRGHVHRRCKRLSGRSTCRCARCAPCASRSRSTPSLEARTERSTASGSVAAQRRPTCVNGSFARSTPDVYRPVRAPPSKVRSPSQQAAPSIARLRTNAVPGQAIFFDRTGMTGGPSSARRHAGPRYGGKARGGGSAGGELQETAAASGERGVFVRGHRREPPWIGLQPMIASAPPCYARRDARCPGGPRHARTHRNVCRRRAVAAAGGRRICIDPGHDAKWAPGAVGRNYAGVVPVHPTDGVPCTSTSSRLSVAYRLKALLEADGASVCVTQRPREEGGGNHVEPVDYTGDGLVRTSGVEDTPERTPAAHRLGQRLRRRDPGLDSLQWPRRPPRARHRGLLHGWRPT